MSINRFDWAFGFAGLACFTSLFSAVISFIYIRWLTWYEDKISDYLVIIDEQNKRDRVDLDGKFKRHCHRFLDAPT